MNAGICEKGNLSFKCGALLSKQQALYTKTRISFFTESSSSCGWLSSGLYLSKSSD